MYNLNPHLHRALPIYLVCFFLCGGARADDPARLIFDKSTPMVFQVIVVDKASGNKSTIGSGFQISSGGVLASNYHVVSDYILEPEKYFIRVLDNNKTTFDAVLITFDIVHDLALLQVDGLAENSLPSNRQPLSNGDRIFSLGNPHDLGMTIVEGIYNGLVEGSRYQKYLFSGTLSGGMSGGPALNSRGEVIGINVSKGGEQISFLVPVEHLIRLANSNSSVLERKNYNKLAVDLLTKDQNDYYEKILNLDWPTKKFKQFDLPDKIHDSLKCWGHTADRDEELYDVTHRHCRTDDRIYISDRFYTGGFSYDYRYYSSAQLNTVQFFNMLEKEFSFNMSSSGSRKDVTNFACVTNFLVLDTDQRIPANKWKTSTCIRGYIDYPGIYDSVLLMMRAETGSNSQHALKIQIAVSGIDSVNLSRLHHRFLEIVKWRQ